MTEFERRFIAHGQCYGLRAESTALLDELAARVPFGWHAASVTPAQASVWYTLRRAGNPKSPYRLTVDGDTAIESPNLPHILDGFERHAELLAAARARDVLFVHAGVVAWNGQAIVMPGSSLAGKTTLVQACLKAGATYLLGRVRSPRPRRTSSSVRASAVDQGQLECDDSPRGGRDAGRRDRDDAAAYRTRPCDRVPRRRAVASAPLDGCPDAAGADAPHRRRPREPGALDAYSETGGGRWNRTRRCTRRRARAGRRGARGPPNADATTGPGSTGVVHEPGVNSGAGSVTISWP